MARGERAVSRLALVVGGVRSGKSAFALALARSRGPRRVFVATAQAFDDEMRERIAQHVDERGRDFATVEAPHALEEAIAGQRGAADVVVIDCLTLWLSNLLLADTHAAAIESRVDAVAHALEDAPFATVLVSSEVGMGVVPESKLGRAFRDVAGRAHQRFARSAREIYLAAIGTIVRLRPGPVELVAPGGAA
jgi:adenosylcobinamide kinase/adenosylcobinamide-phosphate guanylyltransferase